MQGTYRVGLSAWRALKFDLESRLRLGGQVGLFGVRLAANWSLAVVAAAGPVVSVGLFVAAVLAVG